jgi:hypothetical protein
MHTMTGLGKTLVFLNLAFSVLLMGWALGVYTNRIDFSNVTAKGPTGEQIAGEFAKRAPVIDELWGGVRPAQVNWRGARTALAAQEGQQVKEWEWYHGEMDHNRLKATPKDPARQVVIADRDNDALGVKKGQVDLDPKTGLPKMVPVMEKGDVGLPALVFLDAKLQEVLTSIHEVQDLHEKQIKEAIAETEKLIGPKGLHQRLIDEREKRRDVIAEVKLVRPLVINTVVEAELIHKRHRQLVLRIEELKRIGVAVRDR